VGARDGEQAGARRVDLNSDVGESLGTWVLGDDAALLELVTSANVACGFHAGDPGTLRRTCALAAQRGVVVGAQVGYPDLVGFGRRFLDMAPDELADAVVYQVGALDALARVTGTRVAYVKPHGALYSAVVRHEAQAAAVVQALVDLGGALPVVGLPGSTLLRRATEAGLRTVREAFADRAYEPDGSLRSRREPGAVLHDPPQVADRVLRMVERGEVVAVDGTVVDLVVDSVCVHGDSPGAVAMARAVRTALEGSGTAVRPFAGP